MIPHKLHMIWMGERPVPVHWMQPWVDMHPEWEFHLWNEEEIRALPLMNVRHFNWYARRKRWNGAADIARIEILATQGGVYVDIDSTPLLPLDDASFMTAGFFAGIAEKRRVANGTIGSIARHPVLETYMQMIRAHPLSHMLPPSRTIGSVMLTKAIETFSDREDVVVLPRRVFHPVSIKGIPIEGEDLAYIQHHWAGTRKLYDVSD